MGRAVSTVNRVEWLDSLKGILIVLVVVGHVLLPINSIGEPVTATYDLIYLFHMPLFVFVSGLLAKHAVDKNGHLRVDKVLTYLLIGFAYGLLLRIWEGSSLTFSSLLTFPSAPWYVISLASWMILTPLFDRLKPSWGLIIAVIVSISSTIQESQTDFFALSRTAHFLPYYVAGYYLKVSDLGKIREGKKRAASLFVGFAAAILFLVFRKQLDPLYFFVYGSTGCALSAIEGTAGYLLISAFGIALSIGCVAATPERSGILSFLGKRTLQIYVIHRFARGSLVQMGFYEALSESGLGMTASFLVLLGISALICALSCIPVITAASRKLLSLSWKPLRRAN